ncbi:asparagine synthase-related protein [Kitasatospora sp. NPDC048365]|uniref:asparagine synthase-related protein n=1 Tax=Kitasatospora sp. NPDC048365 TaxID=3364050 RepID=UPI00371F2481
MRWLTGWSGLTRAADPALAAVRPLAATTLWAGPNSLWAVGDWRPDEIRLATLRPGAPATVTGGLVPLDPTELTAADSPATVRLAVLGRCGASDRELAAGLAAARGGAVRHLTHWPGSYTVVLSTGARSTVLLTDLAGALPVFHTPFAGGTAYATAALPLADLTGAPVDPEYLAAHLAVPDSPEATGTRTPYAGVHRVPPGHTLGIRSGRPYLSPYEPEPGPEPREEPPAVRELTRALLEAVRCRVRTAPEPTSDRPRLGVDLSYGTASATVALLAAAVPLPAGPAPTARRATDPPVRTGAVKGSWARPAAHREDDEDREDPGPTLAAVTLAAHDGPDAADRPGTLALAVDAPRLRHILLPAALPYTDLSADPLAGPLTDEPGTALLAADRFAAAHRAGGADHLTGYGARQVLDGHPARLADLIRTGRARELLAPVVALAGADRATAGALTGTVRTPVTVLRAARRLARTRYAEALDDLAVRLTVRPPVADPVTAGTGAAADLAWTVPAPAARLLSDEALAVLAQRLRTAARGPAPAEHPGARRARLALHRHAADFRTLVHATEQHGQRLHAPFLDNQVVRAARLLPDETRLQPGARHALLRAVLAGTGRADLPADWGRGPRPDRLTPARTGLRLAADTLADLFHRPLLGDAGLIDVPAVRRTLALATDPEHPLPPATVGALADLIATELWLRRTAARRHGSSWTNLPGPRRPALDPRP